MEDKNNMSPAQQRSAEAWGEDIDFNSLLKSIWKTRWLVFSTAFLSLLVWIALLTFSKIATPTTHVYKKAIQFTFAGLQNHEYPNGRIFSISDLTAPLILQKVYQDNDLKKYGLKRRQFISSISITPSDPGYSAVLERYRIRLANEKLNFAESKEIEKNMAKELSEYEGRSAIISMVSINRIGISSELAYKILDDIAKNWAQISIEKYGVLKTPKSIEKGPLIEEKDLKGNDIATKTIRLIEASKRIRRQLSYLDQVNEAQTIVDSQTGYGLETIRRKVLDFENYDLQQLMVSALKASKKEEVERSRAVISRRRKSLEVLKKGNEARAKSLKERLVEYTQKQMVNVPTLSNTASVASRPKTEVSQLSGDFIQRIIALSEQKLGIEFRQDLLKEQLKYQSISINQNIEIAELTSFISIIDDTLATNSNNIDNSKNQQALQVKIDGSILQLNKYWQTLGRFYEMLSVKNMSYQGHLYSSSKLSKDERYTAFHPLYSPKTWFFVLAGIISASLMALFFGLISQRLRDEN